MIEPEPFAMHLSLDTSRFQRACEHAQFNMVTFGQGWSQEDRMINVVFNTFWNFDDAMQRIRDILGEDFI